MRHGCKQPSQGWMGVFGYPNTPTMSTTILRLHNRFNNSHVQTSLPVLGRKLFQYAMGNEVGVAGDSAAQQGEISSAFLLFKGICSAEYKHTRQVYGCKPFIRMVT